MDKETKELRAIADFIKIPKEGLQLMMDIMQSHLRVNLWQSFIMARYLSFVGMNNQQEIL